MRIPNALGFLISAFLLSACATSPALDPVTTVEVRTIEISRPAPIVPNVDQLDLRPVQWIVITPENVDEKFTQIRDGEMVFFALTREGYENLALNMSDIRTNIEQYQRIIAVYKRQF